MNVSPAHLRKLAELRLDAEQMAGVLELLASLGEAEEERKAKVRERVRRHREKHSCNVTETLPVTLLPPPERPSEPNILPLEDNQNLPPIVPPSRKKAKPKADDASFVRFWNEVPRKVAKDDAWREFGKLVANGTDPETLISAARSWSEAVRKRGTAEEFIPHPRKWLHSGQWRDYAPGADGPQTGPPQPEFASDAERDAWLKAEKRKAVETVLERHGIRKAQPGADPVDAAEPGRDTGSPVVGSGRSVLGVGRLL